MKVVRVKVVARVRPLLASERRSDSSTNGNNGGDCISFPAERTLVLALPGLPSLTAATPGETNQSTSAAAAQQASHRAFEFDAVLDPSVGQEDIFEASGVKEYIDSALNGFAATVFAYGQTGSGSEQANT